MTPHQHYLEAEHLMELALKHGPEMAIEQQMSMVAMAQVHATLSTSQAGE